MNLATIYFSSLSSDFALQQDWSQFELGVFASDELSRIQTTRKNGLKIFSYTHEKDSQQVNKLEDELNDGLFLDWSSAPNPFIDKLVEKLHGTSKKLIVNTGWGQYERYDYGRADIVLLESFLGAHSGDDGSWPVTYSRTEMKHDFTKLIALKKKGYKVITLSYGASNNIDFARYCFETARAEGSDYFIYSQVPGWEKEDSGFQLFPFSKLMQR